jgi:hypothetical protein
MYDVIYEAEIALCNINKQPLQLKKHTFIEKLQKAGFLQAQKTFLLFLMGTLACSSSSLQIPWPIVPLAPILSIEAFA